MELIALYLITTINMVHSGNSTLEIYIFKWSYITTLDQVYLEEPTYMLVKLSKTSTSMNIQPWTEDKSTAANTDDERRSCPNYVPMRNNWSFYDISCILHNYFV